MKKKLCIIIPAAIILILAIFLVRETYLRDRQITIKEPVELLYEMKKTVQITAHEISGGDKGSYKNCKGRIQRIFR